MGAGDLDACSIITGLAFLVVYVVAWWKIFDKAGWAAWVALLMLVPLLNAIIFLVFAFSEWPVVPRDQRLPTAADTGGGVELPYEGLPLTPRGKPFGEEDS